MTQLHICIKWCNMMDRCNVHVHVCGNYKGQSTVRTCLNMKGYTEHYTERISNQVKLGSSELSNNLNVDAKRIMTLQPR